MPIRHTAAAINATIAELEAAQAELAGNVKANADVIADLSTRLAAAEAAAKTMASDIEALKAAHAQVIEGIQNMQGSMDSQFGAIDADLEALKAASAQSVLAIQNLTGSIAALEVEVEAAKAYTDKMAEEIYVKIETVEKALTNVNNLLSDEVADRIKADEEIYAKIDVVEQALSAVNNLLSDEAAKREAEDAEIYKQLNTAVETISAVNTVLTEEIEKAKKELSEEMASQVESAMMFATNILNLHNELAKDVADIEARLAAQEEALEAQLPMLGLRTEELNGRLSALEPVVEAILKKDAEVDAILDKYEEQLSSLGIRTEQLNGQLEALVPVIEALQNNDKNVETVLDEHAELLEMLGIRTEQLNGQLEALVPVIEDLKAADKKLEEVLESHEETLAALGLRTEELKGMLTKLGSDVVDLKEKMEEEFNNVKLRTEELKGQIEAIGTKVDNLEKNQNEILKNINTLTEMIGSNWTLIQDNATAIKANATAIEALEAMIEGNTDELQKQLDALKNEDSEIYKSIETIQGMISANYNLIGDVKTQLEEINAALEESIKDLEDSLKDTNDKVEALEGRLTSLVFVPEYYTNGIETIDYAFMPYHVKVGMEGADEKTGTTTSDGVDFEITAPETEWNYVCDPEKEPKTYVESPVRYVTYFMNPDNANLDGVDFSFISKDIETRASVTAPKVAGDVQLAEVADDNGKVRNAVRVPMTATGYIVDENDGYASASTPNSTTAPVFALNATLADDVDVASDFARLDLNTFHLTALADVEDNHLETSAVKALENDPVFEVVYNGSIDLREKVFTHYFVNDRPTFDYHVQCGDHKIYENDYMNEELPAYEQNPFGLQWDFALVDYVAGGNKTSDSQYATLEGSVLTPCGTQGGKATGKTDITSIGRNPLVRATVSDRNGNVILVSFFKVHILAQSKYTVAETTEWIVPFGCVTTATQTWDQFNDNILTVAGCSKSEFDALYEIETTQNAAKQYALVNGDYVSAENIFGEVTEIPDATGTTTTVLNWNLAAKDLQAIYSKDNNAVTIYVRYIPKQNATNKYAGIYVPLKVTVAKPEGKVTKKLAAYWFDGETKAMINVQEPTNDGNTKTWITDLNQVWSYGAPEFNPTSANPAYTGTFPSFTEDDKNNTLIYKYYFAPEQSSEVFTYADAEWVLTVKNSYVKDAFTTATYEVSKNSDIQGLELKYALYALSGIYANTELRLTNKKDENDYYVIATIDQITGKITYSDNDYAKFLLNKYASVARSEAKLFANIGIVAYNKGETTVDHTYGGHKYMALSLADAINPYYFLRPINVVGNNKGEFIDAKDNGDEVNMFDILDFTDWRNESFLKKDGNYFVNAWYYAYYNVSKVEAFVEEATCDMNGSWEPIAVAPKIELGFEGTATIDWTDKNTAENVYGVGYPDPTLNIYNDFGKNYGKITYKNNGTNVQAFNIKVPVRVTYDWGTIDTEVVIAVKETMGNN